MYKIIKKTNQQFEIALLFTKNNDGDPQITFQIRV